MFDKPSDTILSACARLLTVEDFQTLMSALKDELKEQDIKNRVLDQPHLGRGQGMSIALETIVQTIEQANKTLSVRRNSNSRNRAHDSTFV